MIASLGRSPAVQGRLAPRRGYSPPAGVGHLAQFPYLIETVLGDTIPLWMVSVAGHFRKVIL